MRMGLEGRTAVVTGAGGGLGREIAIVLAEAGARIVAVDREETFGAMPGGWDAHAVNLGAASALERLRELGDALGTLDIVVANAGFVPPWRRLKDLDADEWRQVMDVNVWGVASTLGGLAPAMARSGRGSAIVMASINGYRAHPDQALYTASKHAAVGVMRAAALDLGRDGIRVNALAPGPVATDALLARIARRQEAGGPTPDAALAVLAAQTALGAIVTPRQVANAALWLASDASAGITGTLVPVEAGLG